MTTLFPRAARPAANNSVPSLWLLISRVAARKKCGRAVFRMVQLMPPSPDEHRYAQSSCHPRFSTVQGETGKMNGRTVDDFGWQERAGDELRCANPRKRSAEGNGKKGLERWTAEHRIGETINSFFPKGVNVGIIFVPTRSYNKYKRIQTL